MRNLIVAALVSLVIAGGGAMADPQDPAKRPDHSVAPEPFGPGDESRVFTVEGLSGDDPDGVSLQGLRGGYGLHAEDEYIGRVGFWGAYQRGEGQTVASGGAEVGFPMLPWGPVRIGPRFRLGLEHRAAPPDDGLAALAGIGFEVGLWFGRHVQLAVAWDRDFGFPSGTRDVTGIALRWAHVPGPVRLKSAASRGNREEVRRLIQSGVSMDRTSHEALYSAAIWCDGEMIDMLLQAWEGPADNMSELALRQIVQGCGAGLTGKLLAWGQDPNADYYWGDTILMKAAERGKIDSVRLLVQKGAKVDGRGRYEGSSRERSCRGTALMIAAARGDQAIVDLLLDAGANPASTDSSGCTAEEAARRAGHDDVADHIRSPSSERVGPAPPSGNR
ncbi:MAG TPA: ankyrin repeat domain-containing protein [Verrucomicrobiae bacterium]|nr:ankyrin repeat domain-containing protein [Verrucomicrobiae bacterium]